MGLQQIHGGYCNVRLSLRNAKFRGENPFEVNLGGFSGSLDVILQSKWSFQVHFRSF